MRRRRSLAAAALLAAVLLVTACGATATDPESEPEIANAGTFGESTFDASTWR